MQKKILNEIRKEKFVNKKRIFILLNRFTGTNKNAGLCYNLTPERIMKKLEKNMRLCMWI
jgi:cell division protein YceG involved in septum cleavage